MSTHSSPQRGKLAQGRRPRLFVRISTGLDPSPAAVRSSLDKVAARVEHPTFMSVLFFKRFLQRPFQVASIIPSSKALVERGSVQALPGSADFNLASQVHILAHVVGALVMINAFWPLS